LEASGFIEIEEFPEFLQYLEPFLGFGAGYEANEEELDALVTVLDVGVRVIEEHGEHHERIQFLDVMRALTKRVFMQKQGTSFKELPDNHELVKEISTHLIDSNYKLSSVMNRS
jgi:hypothetical protein